MFLPDDWTIAQFRKIYSHSPPQRTEFRDETLDSPQGISSRSIVNVGRMLTVDLKQLKENVRPAIEYLQSRLNEPIKVKGSQLTLTRTNARAAKLLLRKFLHQLRLKGYRILVIHPGLIEVHAPEKQKQRNVRATQGAKPSAWETIPDLWYLTPPGIIRRGKRSKREVKRTMRGL